MNDFLNPKSMVTPGAAGAVLMFLVNGICFSFPELAPRYVALGLSFVIGLVSFAAADLKPVLRGTLWVLNSLIIFTMGMGAAKVASTASASQQTAAVPPALAMVLDLVAPAVQAQDVAAAAAPPPAADPALRKKLEEQQRQIEALQRQLAQAQASAPAPAAMAPAPRNSFFKEW